MYTTFELSTSVGRGPQNIIFTWDVSPDATLLPGLGFGDQVDLNLGPFDEQGRILLLCNTGPFPLQSWFKCIFLHISEMCPLVW